MKKLTAWLTAVLALGIAALSFAESRVTEQVTFEEPLGQHQENPRLFVLDDTLYSFSRYAGRVLCWKPGEASMRDYASLPQAPAESRKMQFKEMDKDLQAKMEQTVTHVIEGDGKLWAINQFSGKFGELTEHGPQYRAYALDLGGLNGIVQKDVYVSYQGFVSQNTLYLFTAFSDKPFFAAYDISTGERRDTPLQYPGWARPRKAGKAFYVVDIRTASSGGGYAEKLYELDLTTGQIEEIPLPPLTNTKHEVIIKGIYPSDAADGFSLYTESYTAPPRSVISVYGYEGEGHYQEIFKGPLLSENEGHIIFLHPFGGDNLIAVNDKGAAVYKIHEK